MPLSRHARHRSGSSSVVRIGGGHHRLFVAIVDVGVRQFGRRDYIAGVLLNTPDNLVRWLISPQSVKRGDAMPDLGITPGDAADIAAYLYSLR